MSGNLLAHQAVVAHQFDGLVEVGYACGAGLHLHDGEQVYRNLNQFTGRRGWLFLLRWLLQFIFLFFDHDEVVFVLARLVHRLDRIALPHSAHNEFEVVRSRRQFQRNCETASWNTVHEHALPSKRRCRNLNEGYLLIRFSL